MHYQHFFSVGTDSSSHGNIEMPSTVIHFNRDKRETIHHLFDFGKESNKTAVGMLENI